MKISIYRYNPEVDSSPKIEVYELDDSRITASTMLLDALLMIKEQDETLSLRRSCAQGVCGSDALNVNGKNRLACMTFVNELKHPIVVRPLPSLPVIRDLVVDMSSFYRQYENVEPYLQNSSPAPKKERLQSPEDRAKLDGLYECILCAACSTSCPSFWWNPQKFRGPAALLQSARFIQDSRDDQTDKRLADLNDPFAAFRCRGIMSCVDVCPKGLNPTKAINSIKDRLMVRQVMEG